jgi:hypothetical protein
MPTDDEDEITRLYRRASWCEQEAVALEHEAFECRKKAAELENERKTNAD